MGHDDIVRLLEIKNAVDKMQVSIATFEKRIKSIEKAKLPTAYQLLDVLNEAVKVYKSQVYVSSPCQRQEATSTFKTSCQKVKNTIDETGVLMEPRFGDTVNNVLIAIINALSEVLNFLGKLYTWDSSYTYFNRINYSSPEIRDVFQQLSLMSQADEELARAPGYASS
jgi:hypothetical protein